MTTKSKTQDKTSKPLITSKPQVHDMKELFANNGLTVPELVNIMLHDDIKIGNVVTSAKRMDASNAYGVKVGKDEEEQTLKTLTCKVLSQYIAEVDKAQVSKQLEQLETMIDEEVAELQKAHEKSSKDSDLIMPSLSANRTSKLGELLRTYTRKSGQIGQSMTAFNKYLRSLGYNTQTQGKATYRYMLEDTADKLLKNIDSLELTDKAIIINGKELALSFFSCPPLVGGMASGSNSGLISDIDTMFND